MAEERPGSSDGEVLAWSLVAWVFSIVGALVAYLAGPKHPRVVHWARLSIAFFIVDIVAYTVSIVVSLIPFLGHVIWVLVWVAIIVVYVVGIIKVVQGEEWKPPLLWDIAEKIPL